MTGFTLFFTDLKPETREKLLEQFDLNHPEEADWDEHPIALINQLNNPEIPQKTTRRTD